MKQPPQSDLPPVRGWRIAFLVACTIGVCLSADLLRLHVNTHTDPDYKAICTISERVDCQAVALSEHSVKLDLPLAVWGLFGYLAMAALAIWGLRRRSHQSSWPFGILFVMSAFSSVLAVYLLLVSHFQVQSVCIVCIASYMVSFVLVALGFFALRRGGYKPHVALREELRAIAVKPKPFASLSAIGLALLVATYLALPPYWQVKAGTGPDGLPVGVDEKGHIWIGGQTPKLTISEYSDYQCPHCQREHGVLRELIEQFPEDVRLIHRNYPLDISCNTELDGAFHPNACLYARMAYCAAQQDRFWEANDYLFKEGRRRNPISTEELAQKVNLQLDKLSSCLESSAAARAIEHDLEAGRELKINGTPTFVIGEKTYPGSVPPEVLKKALGL